MSTPEPTIFVDVDGLLACWRADVGFYGDEAVVASAVEAAGGGYMVEWGRLPWPVQAGDETPEAALNALMYHKPGRTRILAWPDHVREWWEDNTISCTDHDHGFDLEDVAEQASARPGTVEP